MVVDYYAQGHRAESDLNTHVFNKRPTSVTCLADNLSETELQKILYQERMDAQTGFQLGHSSWLNQAIVLIGTLMCQE